VKILHGPTKVGNQSWFLSRAERELGHQSDHVANYDTWVKFPSDRDLGAWKTKDMNELRERAVFGMTAPFDYDVLHYNFGRSFMYWDDHEIHNHAPYADLKLAKSLGKKVFMTLQGCDTRLAHRSDAMNEYTPCKLGRCDTYQTCIDQLDAQRQNMIDNVLPWCDKVFYLNPELGHFVPRGEFLPYCAIDVDKHEFVGSTSTGGKIKILHAPTSPKKKGTEEILAALEAVKSDFDIEVIVVTGKTHAEAMELYRDSDIVIDQVLTGWYGGFAVEVMAMGKPVMAWIRESDLGHVPKPFLDDMPILQVNPATLADDIRRHLITIQDWKALSAQCQSFVRKWHHPMNIARAMVEAYQNPSAPFNWSAFQ
jgi:hypothetical protein